MDTIIALLIQQIPSIIDDLKARHAASNPTAWPLTSEQVLVAFDQLFTSSELRDELLRTVLLAEIGKSTGSGPNV